MHCSSRQVFRFGFLKFRILEILIFSPNEIVHTQILYVTFDVYCEKRILALSLLSEGLGHYFILTNLLVWSADNICKQFGPSSGPTKCRVCSGSKQFDTLIIFLKEFFKNIDFEKNQQTTKKMQNFPIGKVLMDCSFLFTGHKRHG